MLKNDLEQIALDTHSLALLGDNTDGVYRLLVAYDQALDVWKALRLAASNSGYCPAILTTEPEIDVILRQIASYECLLYDTDGLSKRLDSTTLGIIERGLAMDPHEWLSHQVEYRSEDLGSGESFE